jgi:hypothetical protein
MEKNPLIDLIFKAGVLFVLVALVFVEWQKGQKPLRCEVTLSGRQYDELIAKIDEIRNDAHDSADALAEMNEALSGQ